MILINKQTRTQRHQIYILQIDPEKKFMIESAAYIKSLFEHFCYNLFLSMQAHPVNLNLFLGHSVKAESKKYELTARFETNNHNFLEHSIFYLKSESESSSMTLFIRDLSFDFYKNIFV